MVSQYLPLTEYASKHRVSISTLRRRIKAEDIQYAFEDGKYLILDQPMSTHQRIHRPSLKSSDESLVSAQVAIQELGTDFTAASVKSVNELASKAMSHSEQGIVELLLAEIKKAYALVLQEKEEQILLLKEEVSDLKTLVRVLESQDHNTHNF
jgi:hypothetical protein